MRLTKLIAIALLFQSTLMPVRAQYTNPYTGRTFNNPMSSFLDTVIKNNMQMQNLMTSQMISRNMLQQSLSRRGLKQTKKQQVEADRFARYRGTMFKTARPVMPAKLAAMFVKTPGADRENMTKLFDALLKAYEIRSKEQKAPSNDLARTLAYCIAANYAYATEQEVSASGLIELRKKIRAALTADEKFRAMSDAKKQQLSESIIILTHFMALGYDNSKESKDVKSMTAFKQFAQFNLQTMLGVPSNQVRLEKTGLVIAR